MCWQQNKTPPTMPSHPSPRLLAWQALCRWERGGVFADALIHSSGRELPAAADRAMLQAIVLSTLRHLTLLEHMLNTLRGGRHTQQSARWLIISGLCQLFILHWAEYAVVNEVVALAPPKMRGLVNAVLREALRRAEDFRAELPTLPLAVRYSVPEWLVERWLLRFGREECEALLASLGEPAPVCVRQSALRPLPAVPPEWQPVPDAPGWYSLGDSPLPQAEIADGRVYVADPSTRHSVLLLDPRPGEKILDACAAPGGKSIGILSATRGECDLLATDAERHRLPQLRENLARSGAAHVRVARHDWTRPCPAEWRGAFDAILLDVPCSNSGVFRRRVDARWRLTPAELTKLTATQLRIAENALAALRPGGRLVYSTCSIEPEENTLLVRQLLDRHPHLRQLDERLILPHQAHADGAYAALIVNGD